MQNTRNETNHNDLPALQAASKDKGQGQSRGGGNGAQERNPSGSVARARTCGEGRRCRACPRKEPWPRPLAGGAAPSSRGAALVPLPPWRATGTALRASSARSAPGSPRAWARPRAWWGRRIASSCCGPARPWRRCRRRRRTVSRWLHWELCLA